MNRNTVISIVVFIALIVGAIGINWWLDERKADSQTRAAINAKNDTTTHWKDQDGTEHAARLTAEGKLADMEALYKKDMDEASRRLQISKRQIDGLQSAIIEIKGKYKAAVTRNAAGDSIRVVYMDSFSHWYETIAHDTAYMSYDIQVPLNVAQYWTRRWLLGNKVKYIDAYSLNPSVHICDLTNVRIEGKAPGRFGIGPYVGISLAGPSVGIAFTYSLIRF